MCTSKKPYNLEVMVPTCYIQNIRDLKALLKSSARSLTRPLGSWLVDSPATVSCLISPAWRGDSVDFVFKVGVRATTNFFQHPCLAANWSSPFTSSQTWTTPKQFESKLELGTGRNWHTYKGLTPPKTFTSLLLPFYPGDSRPWLFLP